MTLPRLYEMQRYWERHPPVGDLVAAYLGYGPETHQSQLKGGPGGGYGSPEELIAAFASAAARFSSTSFKLCTKVGQAS